MILQSCGRENASKDGSLRVFHTTKHLRPLLMFLRNLDSSRKRKTNIILAVSQPGASDGQGTYHVQAQVTVWCAPHCHGRLPKGVVHRNAGCYVLTLVCLQQRLGRQDEKGDRKEGQRLNAEA